ncbi:MAG: general secretion pathway protein GspB [Gammaproteobacteria bacterium]
MSFSATELSDVESTPILNKPKLLIDGVGENNSFNSVPSVRDLPESSRNKLNQYEVNVHVFDDNPIRRFVLINMNKYKEGDRITDGGPLVEQITSTGVVVDYGSGRALLPSK